MEILDKDDTHHANPELASFFIILFEICSNSMFQIETAKNYDNFKIHKATAPRG